jgi:hypothetical protein
VTVTAGDRKIERCGRPRLPFARGLNLATAQVLATLLSADLPRRSLPLKGRQDPVEVVTLRLDEPPAGSRSA